MNTNSTPLEAATPTPEPSYAELRRAAYPPIEEQLDAIWKGGQWESYMYQRIHEVKRRYPKPVPRPQPIEIPEPPNP